MRNKQSTHETLQRLIEANTTKVKLAATDIHGVLRGKLISFDKFKSVAEKGFGFCNVVFGWDSGDIAYDNASYTGWHTGYPDATAMIDMETFREVPWEDNLPFFLADFGDENGKGLAVCPRTLLKRITKQSKDAGYIPSFSQ